MYKTFNLQDEDEEERDGFSNVERPQLPDRGSERSILALIDNTATTPTYNTSTVLMSLVV